MFKASSLRFSIIGFWGLSWRGGTKKRGAMRGRSSRGIWKSSSWLKSDSWSKLDHIPRGRYQVKKRVCLRVQIIWPNHLDQTKIFPNSHGVKRFTLGGASFSVLSPENQALKIWQPRHCESQRHWHDSTRQILRSRSSTNINTVYLWRLIRIKSGCYPNHHPPVCAQRDNTLLTSLRTFSQDF